MPMPTKKNSIRFRTLTELEKEFAAKRKQLLKVTNVVKIISLNQHGINTTGRGLRATRIFTRQTLSAISLERILPNPRQNKDPDVELWDLCTLASMSRNILEGFLAIYYSGTECVSDSEAELRFFIGQLHRNIEWYKVHKAQNSDAEMLSEFEAGMSEEKERIKNHPFLSELSTSQKNKALKGDEMYYTKADFASKKTTCKDITIEYLLLSNFVHPLPLSIERIDNDRGRGESNQYDCTYSIACIDIAIKYLTASVVEITDFFHDTLGLKYKNIVDEIRTNLTD